MLIQFPLLCPLLSLPAKLNYQSLKWFFENIRERVPLYIIKKFVALSLKGLGHAWLILFNLFISYWLLAINVKLAEQESFICKITAT